VFLRGSVVQTPEVAYVSGAVHYRHSVKGGLSVVIRGYAMNDRLDREPWWTRHAAILIAGGYCLVSLIYIAVSDQMVLMLFDDPERITFVQSIKGKVFVVVSSTLLFAVMHVAFSRVRRAQHAELAASEHYRTIIETTNEGVWLVDADGVTTFVNEHMAKMLGRKRSELIGLSQTEVVDEEWIDALVEQFRRQQQGNHDHGECRLIRSDGKTLWVIIAASPQFDADGRFDGCIRMVTDITQLKNTERALKESLKSQRQLLNELDHRVRNNLSSLVSLVDISRGGASDVARFAESIHGRIDAMNRAYGLLSSSGWTGQDLQRLLHALLPSGLAGRIDLAGPRVTFAPHLSGAVAITVHELLTNAMLHGALSNDEGRIGIMWRMIESADNDAPNVELRWTEAGGPPIVSPVTSGNGMRLISGLVQSDLRGKVMFNFPPEGARHIVRIRLDEAGPPRRDATIDSGTEYATSVMTEGE
jgi:PAS domain S-box-containing protein